MSVAPSSTPLGCTVEENNHQDNALLVVSQDQQLVETTKSVSCIQAAVVAVEIAYAQSSASVSLAQQPD